MFVISGVPKIDDISATPVKLEFPTWGL